MTCADLPLHDRVVGKILSAQARALGEAPFVHSGASWHSFAEMDRRANRVANGLASLGIGKGARVALLLSNRLEHLDLWFGLSRLGAVQIPINPEYKSEQIAQVLRRAPVQLVIAETQFLSELDVALSKMPYTPEALVLGALSTRFGEPRSYAEIVEQASEQEVPAGANVSGADAGVIMNTSGTTGPSKGVVLSHAQQYILGRNIAADMELGPSDVYYNFFPLFHNTAQAMITMPALLSGARMVLTERFSASRFWPDCRQHGCTAFYYIGEILRILLVTGTAADALGSRVRVGWGIGASAADFSEFQSRFGVRLCTGYGSTEANVPCFLPRESAKPGSAGRALSGFEIRIANEAGEPALTGVHGEILVRSKEPCALMLGYDAEPAATVAAWRDLWFHSGDSGYLDADEYLFFTGRLKDVIRVRGENVSAFEVEATLATLAGVLEVAAIAVPAELGGDDLKVCIVASEQPPLTAQMIMDWARARLPRYSVPRYVEFFAALPKTPTNKVQKHLLRAQAFTANTWDCLQLQTARSRSH